MNLSKPNAAALRAAIREILDAAQPMLDQVTAASRTFGHLFATEAGAIGAIAGEVPVRQAVGLEQHMLFGETGLDAPLGRISDLGLSWLLDPEIIGSMLPGETDAATAAALEVPTCSIRSFDPRENEAWFLSAFVNLYFKSFGYTWSEGLGSCHRTNSILELGRLLEWWRWRRLGLDQMAVREQNADKNRRKGGDKLVAEATPRRERARQIAQEILLRRRVVSVRDLAHRVHEAWGSDDAPSVETLRKRHLKNFVGHG